jgi:hypothetical protein
VVDMVVAVDTVREEANLAARVVSLVEAARAVSLGAAAARAANRVEVAVAQAVAQAQAAASLAAVRVLANPGVPRLPALITSRARIPRSPSLNPSDLA